MPQRFPWKTSESHYCAGYTMSEQECVHVQILTQWVSALRKSVL